MAVPAYAAAGAGAASTTGTLSVPYPASISAGHLLLLHVFQWTSSVANPTTPTDWTLQTSHVANSIEHFIYSKTATGSESGNLSVTVTSSAQGHYGRMYRFTGDTGTWAFEAGNNTSGTDDTVDMPSQVTTGVDRLAVAFTGINDLKSQASATGESGGDWTEAVAEFTSPTGSDASIGLQTAGMASAGTISGGNMPDFGAGQPWISTTLAIYVATAATDIPNKVKGARQAVMRAATW